MSVNILLITADQWRADCLSSLGHPVVKTPNLDRLAGDGVSFLRHFAQCVPCGPSRASLHTGMYMMNHRSVRNGTPLDGRFTNIALETRKAGYNASLLGYTDTSLDPRGRPAGDPLLTSYTGTLPGFQQLEPGSETGLAWARHLKRLGYDVPRDEEGVYHPEADSRCPPFRWFTTAPAPYKAEHSDTAFMVDRALEFIDEKQAEPWFLHLSLLRPHPPWVAPAPYNAMYAPSQIPPFRRQPTLADEAARHPYIRVLFDYNAQYEGFDPRVFTPKEPGMSESRAVYYGLISEVDFHMGRILDLLQATGQYDRTLVIFTSDHGEQLWDHWMVGKMSYFEQSFRIPLIVRAPGKAMDGARGQRVSAFSEAIDIMPTVLDLIGADIPNQCDGASLAPFLRGTPPARWRAAAHWEIDFRDPFDDQTEATLGIGPDLCVLGVVRGERYKYVHFAALPPVLFDLLEDPDELVNLADDPAHREVLATCAQAMLSWRMTHTDRALTGAKLTPEGPVYRPWVRPFAADGGAGVD